VRLGCATIVAMGRAILAMTVVMGLAMLTAPAASSGAVVEPESIATDQTTAARDHTDREIRYQRKVFHWTNVARRRHDLPPLKRIPCLRRIAVRWAEHLAATGDFEHQDLGVIFRRCDGARSAGENIARGGVTPRGMVRMWMRSSGHRANILSPDFTHLGVGTAVRGGRWTGVQDFARIRR
jgi:uncharacterized protein YkwD